MTSWVALLRGVNVGGIRIRGADLADVFRALGFDGVRTVLASGNVVFSSDDPVGERGRVKARIEAALEERFGYDAWILLVTADELHEVISAYPFEETDELQPYAIFCADDATREELLAAAGGERVTGGPGVVFWTTPKGTTTDTPFAKALAAARFTPRTTNRNLRTLRKLTG